VGFFNVLWARDIGCPLCHQRADFRIEHKFGVIEQFEFEIGDEVKWFGHRASIPKDKPVFSRWCGEGYAECLLCEKDFFVSVIVEEGKFKEVLWDVSRRGYVPDASILEV
jgi:hypothetical protein